MRALPNVCPLHDIQNPPEPCSTLQEVNATTNGGINSAILRYIGAPLRDPTTNQTASVLPMVETNLHVCRFTYPFERPSF